MTKLRSILLLAFAAPVPLFAQEVTQDTEAPISSLLTQLPEDVRVYDNHVSFLANPFLEGRLPGTRGMEIASQYVERHYTDAGLVGPFEGGYRQGFALGQSVKIGSAAFGIAGGAAFELGRDYSVTYMGTGGETTAPVVYCGYGIEKGQDGYRGYPDDADISGKVAMIFRFEPMDGQGKSLWSRRDGTWTGRAGFTAKLRALAERGATGVIIVNTPGADDPRIDRLIGVDEGNRHFAEVPVLMMATAAAERMLEAGGADKSLLELRQLADQAGVVQDLGFEIAVDVELEIDELIAENVIGLLPGKGRLADEYVVIGAHLDHLGMGNFGSRSGPGELHPGADDNASGSAAIIMLAEKLAGEYAELPESASVRSVLFMCFSAEESGLNGSAYYTKNPAFPIEQHKLMINFDMIGRIKDKRLSVSGAQTGAGMADWLAPYFEATSLDIVQPDNMSGASDHTPFYNAGMPVLFGIIADFHDDYHTPRDIVEKINRVDAVHTITLFHEILRDAAMRPELFEYVGRSRQRRPAAASRPVETAASAERAYVGVTPDTTDTGAGVLISQVTEASAAAEGGIEPGDRLVKWNGKDVADVAALSELLGKHRPGDKVQVTLQRDGKETVLWLTLKARQ